MSIRKKIVTMLGVFALLAGLALVTPQQAQATTGHPYVGVNGYNATTMPTYSSALGGWMKLDLTWTMADLGPYGSAGCESYSYTTKRATYHGVAIGKVVAYVDTSESGIGANLANGSGSDNVTALLGSGGSLPDETTKTNGVSGVSWPTINIKWCPGDSRIRRVVATFYTSGYLGAWTARGSGVIDLTVKGHLDNGINPVTNQSGAMQCMTPSLPGATGPFTDKLNFTYDVAQTGVDTYTVKPTSVTYTAGTGLTSGPDHGLDFNVDADGAAAPGNTTNRLDPYQLPLTDDNWIGPTPTSFTETDGVVGPYGSPAILFPTQAFTTTGGSDPISINARFKWENLGVFCDAHWYLTTAFKAPSLTHDTFDFDDCSGGTQPHGHLVVTSDWAYDLNGLNVHPTDVTIHNDSNAQVAFGAGAASFAGGLSYNSSTSPFGLSTMNTTATVYERTFPAGWTAAVDIGDPTKWTDLTGYTGTSSPNGITLPTTSSPYFELIGAVQYPVGTTCNEGQLDLYGKTVFGPGPS